MLLSYNICVPFLFDADAIIKLQRAEILQHVAQILDCIIPEAVYHEVVTRGRVFNHSDAEAIDRIIQASVVVQPPMGVATPDIAETIGVNAGEKELLGLFYSSPAEVETIILIDDRRFLALLHYLEIPALIPADFIVLMARQGFLLKREARNALEHIRPLIRETAYQQALKDLEE